MSPKISYSDFTKQIKGSTSHWINSNDFIEEKFAWQKGSRGFSVSKSKIITIINYIKKQKKHHKVVPFKSEFDKLLKVHGLEPENGNR